MSVASIVYRPHQDLAHEACKKNYSIKIPMWCVVSPCGGGKSLMMRRIAIPAAEIGRRVFIYCHRVMLLKQTIDAFDRDGVDFGVIASGYKKRIKPEAMIQVCMIQTVRSRLNKWRHEIPRPDIVIVDEFHQNQGGKATAVLLKHAKEGARIIGYTATPVKLRKPAVPTKENPLTDEQKTKNLVACHDLVMAGTYQDMIDCKAHMPVVCYGPDRPEIALKKMLASELSEDENKAANSVPTIFANVYENWRKLNPDMLPAIGFAPGVQESKWFVEEFRKRGVPCAHIDGESIVLVYPDETGELVSDEVEATEEWRQHVIDGSREGLYKIVWNRFVLREAIDCVEWYQAIIATTVHSLANYLQMTGRILRYCDKYDHKLIVDHGGCIDRHGFPNVERDWEIGDNDATMHSKEMAARKKNAAEDAEPICCPRCNAYRLSGKVCHACGHKHIKSVRMVRQLDGTLVKLTGRIVKHKPEKVFADYYRSAVYACAKTDRTVAQAYAYAKKMAYAAGCPVGDTGSFKLPEHGSDKWGWSVRLVYPWINRKKAQ